MVAEPVGSDSPVPVGAARSPRPLQFPIPMRELLAIVLRAALDRLPTAPATIADALRARDVLRHSDRRRVIDGLFHEGPRSRQFHARFALLTAVSASIAVLGILSDSTAVVIGAMLVAPLLGPLLGVAGAVVMGWPARIARQSATLAAGAGLAVGIAIALSFVIPGDPLPLPAELVARTSPNLLDLGIALAAGAAGAYGQVRRHASDALTGVAVAVALVPPLIVLGITLQLTEWSLAFGASLLFLANVTGIIIAASLTFVAAGLVPGRRLLTGNASIASVVRWAAIAVIIVVLPMQFGRGRVLPPVDQTAAVIEAVENFVEEGLALGEIVTVAVEVEGGVTDINVVLASPIEAPPVNALAEYLAEKLDTAVAVSLQVVETDSQRAPVTRP